MVLIHILKDVLENVNPDLSDSEFIDNEADMQDTQDADVPGSDAIDAPTPGQGVHGDESDGEDEDEGEIDEELAAELDLALGDEGDEGDDDEGDEDDEDASDEDEDEDEDDETSQSRRLLNEEIRDLEAAVAKKKTEISSSANPLIRVCFYSSCYFRVCLRYSTASLRRCAEKTTSRPRFEAYAT